MTTGTPTITTFIIYILLMLFLGWLGFRATQNLSDFILGGRRLGSFVTALSAGASDMSGWLLMGLPGAVFVAGLAGAWIAVGLIIGAWLNWHWVAKRLRFFTEKSGALTLPDYLTERFQDRSHLLRITACLAILIFFTIYCSAGIVSGARLFESVFNIPYQTALWAGAAATITYVFLGGFLAISWTDTIQALLIFTALIIAPLTIIYANHGLSSSLHTLNATHPHFANPFMHLNAIGILSLLAWGLGYFGQPHILVRFMAAKSVKAIPKAKRINLLWMTCCLAGAVSVGFFGAAFFAMHPEHTLANPEKVFIETAKALFNPWLTGILLAAILAAIMSNLSCQLLVSSSALTEDLYKTFFRKNASQKELVLFGRLMILLIAAIAIWIASNPHSQILGIVSYAWAGFGAAFGPVILLSLTWPQMTRNGALAGILIGTLTVIIWKQFAWFHLYEIIPGFFFALLGIMVVSKLSVVPETVTSLFNRIDKELQIAG